NRDGNFQIYGMNADGSHQTRLTNNLATDENPNWGVVNPLPAFWTYTGSLNTARQRHTATFLMSGKVLVAGGSSNGSCELYDLASETGSVTESPHTDVLPNVAAIYNGRATRLLNGNVLLAGTGGATEIYDVPSGAWTLTGSLNPNFDHSYPPVLSLLTTGD